MDGGFVHNFMIIVIMYEGGVCLIKTLLVNNIIFKDYLMKIILEQDLLGVKIIVGKLDLFISSNDNNDVYGIPLKK